MSQRRDLVRGRECFMGLGEVDRYNTGFISDGHYVCVCGVVWCVCVCVRVWCGVCVCVCVCVSMGIENDQDRQRTSLCTSTQ